MKLTLILLLAAPAFAQSDRAEAQRNPFAGNAQALAAGRTLYNQTCVNCHGTDARGERGPALNTGNFPHGNADGEIFINIRSGIRGTDMPAFSRLTTDQTWQIITYLRSLAPASMPAVSSNDRGGGNAAAGKQLVEGRAGCLNCHTIGARGTFVGADLSAAGKQSAQQLRSKIENPTSAAGGGGRGFRRGAPLATVTVKTRDGHEFMGPLKNRDALTVQMIDGKGVFHSFDRARVSSVAIDLKSFMPADFSKRFTPAEIGDMVAYLKTLDGSITAELGAGTGVSWERIRDAAKEPQNVLSYWGNLEGRHYSPLAQITTANVKNLQAQWAVQLPGDGIVETSPLVVDGIMYTMGPVGGSATVRALDAKTGRQLWRYDRKQKVTNPYEINRVSRGISILGNRLFFGTLDGALIALDTRSGAALWEIQVGDSMVGTAVTSPPLVLKDMIVTGVAGGEFGARGYVDAYDPATGKQLWRWYSVPKAGEPGVETWLGDSWQHGGGSTWLTGTYDAELDTIYWPIGNPGPDINGDVRKGDNLYTCSVVALNPKTGKMKWFYQFTPNDTHDWDSTEDMLLVDRMWHGQMRKLLLHGDRNGVFYVLDRTNGKFLAASPFVRATWQKGFDANGRPIFADNWRANEEGVTVYPSIGGGSNFQSPSYSQLTGWMYFAYYDGPGRYSIGPAPFEAGKQFQGRGSGGGFGPPPEGQAPPSQGVLAMDPETGKVQWRFELTENSLAAGVLATGGGVLFAASNEGNLTALDQKTGKPLWHFNAGASIPASPISYSVDGRQYVAVSSANVLYSFALPE